MVTNPIYEGPQYETINDGTFAALTPTASESPDLTNDSPFYTGRIMPNRMEGQARMFDPKREYENCKALSDGKIPESVPKEDTYTLMNPAGSGASLKQALEKESDNNEEEGRSNAPKPQDNSSIRYVYTDCWLIAKYK